MQTSSPAPRERVILGIDPGYADMGFGVISVQGALKRYQACGTIHTSNKLPMPDRLELLYRELGSLMQKYHPSLCAIEKLFFFKNVINALDVAQARGVALLAAREAKLPIVEYTPLEIKQSLTSYGKADKIQVAHMVRVLLGEEVLETNDNALDALAIALCAAFRNNTDELRASSTRQKASA